jgi:hypothetical protein
MHRRGNLRAWGGLLTLWLAVSLACNIQAQPDSSSTSDGGTGDAVADSNGGSGEAPTVQIISPSNGQQVALGQDVDIRVAATHSSGINRLQLNVGNRTSSTKSFPEPSSSAEALLRWRPDRQGTFELSVIAFGGGSFSQPATLTLQVVGRDDPINNPVTGQPAPVTAGATECIGRVLISNLRIRTGPGTNFENAGNFALNEQVTLIAQSADGAWFKMRRLDASENWVINNPEWIEATGNCSALPVAS